jgi:hypothetical protein
MTTHSSSPNIIDNSKTLIIALLGAVNTTDSTVEQLLLLNAARKIAQLEGKLASGGSSTSGLPTKQITDRQNHLLQHCLGGYDPEDATECDHFRGENPPSVPEAAALLILLQTGDFSATMNEEKLDAFSQHPDAGILFEASEIGESEEEERAGISDSEFFNAINGGPVPTVPDTLETAEETRKVLLNAISEDVAANGEMPEDQDERIDRGVGVGVKYLTDVFSRLPESVDADELREKLEAEHAHLGMHIENGDIPPAQYERMKGFHDFLGRILQGSAQTTSASA